MEAAFCLRIYIGIGILVVYMYMVGIKRWKNIEEQVNISST